MSCALHRPDEQWIDFIKRAIPEAEDRMMTSNSVCWVPADRCQKWRLVSNIVQAADGRWSKRLLGWQPRDALDKCGPPYHRASHRRVGLAISSVESNVKRVATPVSSGDASLRPR